jgi:hypothetical protein
MDSLQEHKKAYAHDVSHTATLSEAIDELKPSVLIGVSTIPKSFDKQVGSDHSLILSRNSLMTFSTAAHCRRSLRRCAS